MPPWLAGSATLNLWLSPGATSSAPHCDESHNILTVLRGRKTVVLLPPSSGADLGALPAWSASPHHCQCSSEEAARHPHAVTVTIDVGEALLIPAGWYHAVASPAGTVAVNCWWPPALMCRSQKALAMKAFRKNQGPQVAFFARRALIRRQRAAVTKAAGELRLADLLRAASTYPTRWRRRLETAPPAACAALYALWTREADGACEPLLEVFAPEERGAVVARLRRGRDKVSRARGVSEVVSAVAAAVGGGGVCVCCNNFWTCRRSVGPQRATLPLASDVKTLARHSSKRSAAQLCAALVACQQNRTLFRGSDASIRTHSSYLHRSSIALAQPSHKFQALLSGSVFVTNARP